MSSQDDLKEHEPISSLPEAAPDAPEEEAPTAPPSILARLKGSWRSLSVAFGIGLLLGWIVLGWLILPVKWINTDPWDLRPEYQERYLSLVAEDYWRTGDLRRALADLEGWDETALARRLASMEARERDPERRQHIAALAEALKLQEATRPFWASLLAQRTILLSTILSALPMVGAVMLVFASFIKRQPKERMVEELDELVVEGETELTEEALQQQLAMLAETQPEDAQSEGQETTEEEQKEETTTPEATEEQTDVSDLLSGLFDEDSESFEHLQMLSRGLADVDVDSLLDSAREVLGDLVRVCTLRRQAA